MSWTESEKLNEWILRAYDNGKREEQERIIKLLKKSACCQDECSFHEELTNMIALIKGQPNECECDPCGNENCTCQGKRCNFCKGQD